MNILQDLAATIAARKGAAPEESWTAQLLAGGPELCARKFGEEALEVVIEALKGDGPRLAAEAADTLYHLMVLLEAAGVPLSAVEAALESRKGQSGLAEKAARS